MEPRKRGADKLAKAPPDKLGTRSWELFAKKHGDSAVNDDKKQETSGRPTRSDVMLIRPEDVSLYGYSPRQEQFSLVVCDLCKMSVKPQAFARHYERRHARLLPSLEHRTDFPSKSSHLNRRGGAATEQELACVPLSINLSAVSTLSVSDQKRGQSSNKSTTSDVVEVGRLKGDTSSFVSTEDAPQVLKSKSSTITASEPKSYKDSSMISNKKKFTCKSSDKKSSLMLNASNLTRVEVGDTSLLLTREPEQFSPNRDDISTIGSSSIASGNSTPRGGKLNSRKGSKHSDSIASDLCVSDLCEPLIAEKLILSSKNRNKESEIMLNDFKHLSTMLDDPEGGGMSASSDYVTGSASSVDCSAIVSKSNFNERKKKLRRSKDDTFGTRVLPINGVVKSTNISSNLRETEVRDIPKREKFNKRPKESSASVVNDFEDNFEEDSVRTILSSNSDASLVVPKAFSDGQNKKTKKERCAIVESVKVFPTLNSEGSVVRQPAISRKQTKTSFHDSSTDEDQMEDASKSEIFRTTTSLTETVRRQTSSGNLSSLSSKNRTQESVVLSCAKTTLRLSKTSQENTRRKSRNLSSDDSDSDESSVAQDASVRKSHQSIPSIRKPQESIASKRTTHNSVAARGILPINIHPNVNDIATSLKVLKHSSESIDAQKITTALSNDDEVKKVLKGGGRSRKRTLAHAQVCRVDESTNIDTHIDNRSILTIDIPVPEKRLILSNSKKNDISVDDEPRSKKQKIKCEKFSSFKRATTGVESNLAHESDNNLVAVKESNARRSSATSLVATTSTSDLLLLEDPSAKNEQILENTMKRVGKRERRKTLANIVESLSLRKGPENLVSDRPAPLLPRATSAVVTATTVEMAKETVVNSLELSTKQSSMPRPKLKKGHQKGPKIALCKDRDYDPDIHCGILLVETGKQCTHSLTCKNHSLTLRRSVIGRSKPLDVLLEEHRRLKEEKQVRRVELLFQKLDAQDKRKQITCSKTREGRRSSRITSGGSCLDQSISLPEQIATPEDDSHLLTTSSQNLSSPAPVASSPTVIKPKTKLVSRRTKNKKKSPPEAAIPESSEVVDSISPPSPTAELKSSDVWSQCVLPRIQLRFRSSVLRMDTIRLMDSIMAPAVNRVCREMTRPERVPEWPTAEESLQLLERHDAVDPELNGEKGGEGREEHLLDLSSDDDEYSDVTSEHGHRLGVTSNSRCYLSHHPRPIAINRFGAWQQPGVESVYTFNRLEDRSRSAVALAVQQILRPQKSSHSLFNLKNHRFDFSMYSSANIALPPAELSPKTINDNIVADHSQNRNSSFKDGVVLSPACNECVSPTAKAVCIDVIPGNIPAKSTNDELHVVIPPTSLSTVEVANPFNRWLPVGENINRSTDEIDRLLTMSLSSNSFLLNGGTCSSPSSNWWNIDQSAAKRFRYDDISPPSSTPISSVSVSSVPASVGVHSAASLGVSTPSVPTEAGVAPQAKWKQTFCETTTQKSIVSSNSTTERTVNSAPIGKWKQTFVEPVSSATHLSSTWTSGLSTSVTAVVTGSGPVVCGSESVTTRSVSLSNGLVSSVSSSYMAVTRPTITRYQPTVTVTVTNTLASVIDTVSVAARFVPTVVTDRSISTGFHDSVTSYGITGCTTLPVSATGVVGNHVAGSSLQKSVSVSTACTTYSKHHIANIIGVDATSSVSRPRPGLSVILSSNQSSSASAIAPMYAPRTISSSSTSWDNISSQQSSSLWSTPPKHPSRPSQYTSRSPARPPSEIIPSASLADKSFGAKQRAEAPSISFNATKSSSAATFISSPNATTTWRKVPPSVYNLTEGKKICSVSLSDSRSISGGSLSIASSPSSSLWVDSSLGRHPPHRLVFNNSTTIKSTGNHVGTASGTSDHINRLSNHKEVKFTAPATSVAIRTSVESTMNRTIFNSSTLGGHTRPAGYTTLGLSARQTLIASVADDRICVSDCVKMKKEGHRHKRKSTVS